MKEDTYGIAVMKQVIYQQEKHAVISFMRPMKPIHKSDLELKPSTEYNIFLTYGIFPSEATRDATLVRGHKLTGDLQTPSEITIVAAD